MAEPKSDTYFFIKTDNKIEKVFYKDILFVEANLNYVKIITKNSKLVAYNTMRGIEEFLPKVEFIKVHKSYIVAIDKIERIVEDEIEIHEHKIPIGKNYRTAFFASVVNKNLLKR